jgi:formylglycine-generating enzyme required for sulfatase activity
MSDIFISYAREDASVADALARALRQLGWRVFVDRSAIPAGTRFDDWIDAALRETRCVLVLWSESSVNSEWVRNEAHEGLDRNILVPVALGDGVPIPFAFKRRQTRALSGWRLDGETPEDLLRDLIHLLGDPPERASRRTPEESTARRPQASPTKKSRSRTTSASDGRPGGAAVPVGDAVIRLNLEDLDGYAWVSIPGGTFTMGDAAESDAMPHRVTLSPFKISRFPVTNDQYWGAVQAGLVKPPSHWPRGVIPADIKQHPVVNVSWHDASAFAKWLTSRVQSAYGGTVRLPTEAQWEYVARGAEGRRYPWGNDKPNAERANFGGNVGASTLVGTYPAGATPLGVQDMAGNVWEWCHDRYGPYETSHQTDPTGPESGPSRVLRGGSFYNVAQSLRGAFRSSNLPESDSHVIGFRVVWSVAGGQT